MTEIDQLFNGNKLKKKTKIKETIKSTAMWLWIVSEMPRLSHRECCKIILKYFCSFHLPYHQLNGIPISAIRWRIGVRIAVVRVRQPTFDEFAVGHTARSICQSKQSRFVHHKSIVATANPTIQSASSSRRWDYRRISRLFAIASDDRTKLNLHGNHQY